MTAHVIEFNAKAVAPLALFVAKHDIRFYLGGLFVTPSPSGQGIVVAGCNGHQLGLWHDPAGICSEERILKITPAFIAACKKRVSGLGHLPRTVKYIDGRLVVMVGEEELFIQAGKADIEGKYPEIFRVLTNANRLVPGLHGYINAEYLKTIGEAGRLASDGPNFGVGVSHYSSGNDGQGSTVSRFDSAPNFLVLTMPMRSKDDFPVKNPVPAFFIKNEPAKTSQPATIIHPVGSMGEEVAA